MATKKKGRGSIIQLEKNKPRAKCRKWRLVVSLGRDPMTGKYPQKSRTFHGTYSEAVIALQEFIAEIEGGKVVKKSSWTFKEYADHFVKDRAASGEIQPKSLRSMKDNLGGLAFLIGHLKLQEITPTVIQNAYIELRGGNSRHGRKLSGTTLHAYHMGAKCMLDHAKKAGIIAHNPFDKVDPPKKDTKEKTALSSEEYGKLLDTMNPEVSNEMGVLLCATLGLRRGEACGLSWGDIDFENQTVSIVHAFDELGNLKSPKTEAGVRVLPLPDFTRDALLKLKAAKLAELEGHTPGVTIEKKDGSLDFVPKQPVLTDKFDKRINPGAFSKWWVYRREGFGFPGIGLHQLRHTFLSLAAEQGIHPSVMQKLAGHSDPNITMKIYTHVNVDAKKAAIEAMQNAYMRRDRKAS